MSLLDVIVESDINDFNRQFDPQMGRFTSINPLSEERMWVSPYNYAQNNPISRIDPDGALDLTFNFQNKNTAEQDRTDLQNHINQGLGGYSTATIGSDGKVTLTAVEGKELKNASSEVQAFSGAISTAVESKTNVTIGVVNNDERVSTGEYETNQIDIADINAYGNMSNISGVANAASPQSKLAHEVTEQTGKQESGFKGREGFGTLHLKAIGVENRVIGNGVSRIPDTDIQNSSGSFSQYNVGNTRVEIKLREIPREVGNIRPTIKQYIPK
jgi:hypothetical protein